MDGGARFPKTTKKINHYLKQTKLMTFHSMYGNQFLFIFFLENLSSINTVYMYFWKTFFKDKIISQIPDVFNSQTLNICIL